MAAKSLSTIVIFSLLIFLVSCTKQETPYPWMPTVASNGLQTQEGYIKATVEGTLPNWLGYSFNVDFEGEYTTNDNTYEVINSTTTSISIRKNYWGQSAGVDKDIHGAIPYMTFSFNVTNLNSLDSVPMQSFAFYEPVEFAYNNNYLFNCSWGNSTGSIGNITGTGSVSNLSYNAATQVLTGNFTCNSNRTNSVASVIISNGSFSTKLSPLKN